MPQRGPADTMTLRYPDLGTGPVSTEACRSAAYFELERERIFKRSWLNVGRDEDVPRPGDYCVREIEVLNAAFVIVRGGDGRVRALHNACCHRGNRVASGSGNASDFVCGFHGWTYDSQGRLTYVPDEEQFFDFDKSRYGLKQVHCDVWEGFIFINVDERPMETLDEWVGGFRHTLAGYPFGDMVRLAHYRAASRRTGRSSWTPFRRAITWPS